jgi:hypothetical protein
VPTIKQNGGHAVAPLRLSPPYDLITDHCLLVRGFTVIRTPRWGQYQGQPETGE